MDATPSKKGRVAGRLRSAPEVENSESWLGTNNKKIRLQGLFLIEINYPSFHRAVHVTCLSMFLSVTLSYLLCLLL